MVTKMGIVEPLARTREYKIRKVKQRDFEKSDVDKAGKNPKLFRKFIRSRLSVTEQLIRLRISLSLSDIFKENDVNTKTTAFNKKIKEIADASIPIKRKYRRGKKKIMREKNLDEQKRIEKGQREQ